MAEKLAQYDIGDWVVHYAYGIGQIQKMDEKPINGKQVPCFEVKAENGAYWWFQHSTKDNPRVRLVASPDVLQQAQDELQKTIQELDLDKHAWKKRIDEVMASGDFIAVTQIVRDLTMLKTKRKLNLIENRALDKFKTRLLNEWSTSTNTDVETVRPILKRYLNACRKSASK